MSIELLAVVLLAFILACVFLIMWFVAHMLNCAIASVVPKVAEKNSKSQLFSTILVVLVLTGLSDWAYIQTSMLISDGYSVPRALAAGTVPWLYSIGMIAIWVFATIKLARQHQIVFLIVTSVLIIQAYFLLEFLWNGLLDQVSYAKGL